MRRAAAFFSFFVIWCSLFFLCLSLSLFSPFLVLCCLFTPVCPSPCFLVSTYRAAVIRSKIRTKFSTCLQKPTKTTSPFKTWRESLQSWESHCQRSVILISPCSLFFLLPFVHSFVLTSRSYLTLSSLLQEELQEMIHRADSDNDDRVSREDFFQIMSKRLP